MTVDPSWKTNEPSAYLWLEQVLNATVYIGAMAYGAQLIIAFLSIYYIVHAEKRRYVWQSITFIVFLVLLSTIYTAANIHFNEMAWIDYRNYPGGPLAFQLQQQNQTVQVVGNAASIVITVLTDLCLLWRCYVVYHNSWLVIVLPSLVLLALTIMGCFTVAQLALPGSNLWDNSTLNLSIPYWSLSITFNLLVVGMIVARVLLMRNKIRASLGPQYGSMYTGLAAMMIECALPYALISFIFIVLYGLHNTAANLFVPLMIMIEAITPQLIILRVARGHALSKDTLATVSASTPRHGSAPRSKLSTMNFQHGTTTQGSDIAGSTTNIGAEIAMQSMNDSLHELSKPAHL